MDDASMKETEQEIFNAWLAGVPEELRGVARTHGKRAFQMAIWSGTAQHALGILGSQTRGNRKAQQAMVILASIFNAVMKEVSGDEGIKAAMHCKADVELIGQIAHGAKQPGDSVSGGGIILSS